jgi:precorrin-6B methylase 2
MSSESLLGASQRLNRSVEALAALGAELQLRRNRAAVDPRVRQGLLEVVGRIQPELLAVVSPSEEAIALAFIQTFFRQALDLLENPTRAPGWTHTDPVVLQAMGQASRGVVRAINQLASQRPLLKQALERPGTLLDVGTGVGWFAIEAARTWPALSVIGIDSWEPALELARKNLADESLNDRIQLRAQALQHLHDRDVFSLAWLPGPFIPKEVIENSLERVRGALIPDGWIVFGLYAPVPDRLGEALTTLRIVRGGGHPWTVAEVEARLRGLGFDHVESFAPDPPILFVVGHRPAH